MRRVGSVGVATLVAGFAFAMSVSPAAGKGTLDYRTFLGGSFDGPAPACRMPEAAMRSIAAGRAFTGSRGVDQRRAVTLLFLPGPIRSAAPLLTADLQRLPGFAVGLFSPTIGRYSPTQMMLDISQGSRAAASLYRPVSPPAPGLVVDPARRAGRFNGWGAFIDRANSAPADLSPGLLGCEVERAGESFAWAGAEGGATVTAIAAVAGGGTVRRVEIVPPHRLTESIERLQQRFAVVGAQLQSGGFGLGQIRRLVESQPRRLFIVVQAPPNPARTRLLAIAVRGVGDDGSVTSASTRRTGLVAATDISATILQRLTGRRPTSMQGRPIEAKGELSAEDLRAMSARLELVAGRRLPFGKEVMLLFLLLGALVLAVGRLAGRYDELSRTLQRLVGLALLWLPATLLVAAALRPSRATEVDIAVFGSLGLALLTDRLIEWPRAPWLPVATVVAVHAVDFGLLGSRYTGESLLGSNPLYGARFFGAGNELEAVFTVSALLAAGAFLCDRRRRPERWFAAIGVTMALFLGLGRFGADVGGVIMVGAGFGVAVLYAARARLTAARVAMLVLLPVAGLILIVALDSLTGGQSHLTSTFEDANGVGDILTVLDRRFQASVQGARNDGVWAIVLVSTALLLWGWLRRDRLLVPLDEGVASPERRRSYRAALAGGVAATVVGALANDSGPAIMIIGTIYVLMGVLYLRGRPSTATVSAAAESRLG